VGSGGIAPVIVPSALYGAVRSALRSGCFAPRTHWIEDRVDPKSVWKQCWRRKAMPWPGIKPSFSDRTSSSLVIVLTVDNTPGWLAGWLTRWPTGWLSGWLTDSLTGCLADWLNGCLTDWLTIRLTDWVAGWLADQLAGWLTRWLAVWLTDWVVACLTDWPNG
jgi:hypothetical protein